MFKITLIFLLCLLTTIFSGCAQSSIFKVESDQNRKNVFQYCGGQQWGYIKSLSEKENAPYVAAYLENHISQDKTDVSINFVIQTKEDTEILFKNRNIKVLLDGATVYDQLTQFWIIRGEIRIDNLYPPNKFTSEQISHTEWVVRKKKYGGFFGRFALEEPFIVKTNTHPNEETKSNSIKVKLDKDLDTFYFMNERIILPIEKKSSNPSIISLQTPEFIVNGELVKETNYIFHFDQEKLLHSKKNQRCASLEEVFRFGRNKDSWIWWMYPKIED